MWKLLKLELFKIFKRPRTYIAFGAIAAIILLIQVALKFDGKSYIDLLLSNLSGSFEFGDEFKLKLLNGYLICFVILNTLLMQMPLLVALIAGDSIAGEANMGTLRLALTRPVSRTQYMAVKFLASVIYTIALLTWMAALALFGSMLAFGTNDMIVLRSEGIEQIQRADVLVAVFRSIWLCGCGINYCGSSCFFVKCVCRKFHRSYYCYHEYCYSIYYFIGNEYSYL